METVKTQKTVLGLLLVLVLTTGCAVKYVADYDASVKEETIQIAKKVDLFWGVLLATPVSQRQYASFKDRYIEIETDIRGLLMKNKVRSLNAITTKQVENLLELWIQDREIHEREDTFSDFEARRHRKQFIRVFTAIARGESAKDMSPDSE